MANSAATDEYRFVRYLQVAVLIRRVSGNFRLMTVTEPVPMQEETAADEIFPGFVTYVTKYEPPRKIGRLISGGATQ